MSVAKDDSSTDSSQGSDRRRSSTTLPKYRRIKLEELGEFEELAPTEDMERGGSNSMRKAFWTRPEDGAKIEVAVKSLAEFKQTEAIILSNIQSKNVIKFYGAVVDPPQNFFFVMELYHGEILFDYLHQTQRLVERKEAHELALAIADGMTYLHYQAPDAPIRHDNLCSGKVFLHHKNGTRIPKIGGFGNSQLHAATQYTKSHGRILVYGWMPPEAISGKGINLKSDVYSYGIILWEILTGKIPYYGKMLYDIIALIGAGKHPEIPGDCPKDWRELLKRCWAIESKDRPSFRAILGSLEGLAFLSSDGNSDSNPSVAPSVFVQPFKWQLPESDYDQIVFGDTTYTGRLSFIKQSRYKGRLVAARIVVESEVTSIGFEVYMNNISQIKHRNIVTLIGGFVSPKMVALFEWMPVVLQHICPIIDQERFIGIAKDITRGLVKLHSLKPNHIIHGSLSSRTVLLDESATCAKITDFNYYSLNESALFLNRFPDYFDPYARSNNMQLSATSDVYSFGVLLVEMGYGKAMQPHVGITYIRRLWPAVADLATQCMKPPNERPTMAAIYKDELPKLEQ